MEAIVHAHGGSIEVDASPQLGGARFVVTLPNRALSGAGVSVSRGSRSAAEQDVAAQFELPVMLSELFEGVDEGGGLGPLTRTRIGGKTLRMPNR